jgi:hypothetical protein
LDAFRAIERFLKVVLWINIPPDGGAKEAACEYWAVSEEKRQLLVFFRLESGVVGKHYNSLGTPYTYLGLKHVFFSRRVFTRAECQSVC